MKRVTFGDSLIIGEIATIGLAEVSHLAAIFLKLSFTDCALLFGVLWIILLLVGIGYLTVRRKAMFVKKDTKQRLSALSGYSASMKVLFAIFALMVVLQLIFIGMGNAIYRKGDMMAETVESFLVSDSIYQINPMTGLPYGEGIPLRLKILCLPALYGSLCKWTGLPAALMIQKIIPMIVLLSSYVSFSMLAKALFPEEGRKRLWFLVLVSILLWVGAYRYGMEGFNLLCCGWQGVAIRSGVLLPWVFSLCLRRRWFGIVLCVLAEACILWTFYGCGICLAAAVGMGAIQLCCARFRKRAKHRGTVGSRDKEDGK